MRSRTKFPKQKAAADKRAGHISFPHAPIKRQTRGKNALPRALIKAHSRFAVAACARSNKKTANARKTRFAPCAHQGALPLCGSCVRTLQSNGKREKNPALPRALIKAHSRFAEAACARSNQTANARKTPLCPVRPIKAHSRLAVAACARSNQTANARKKTLCPVRSSRRTPALRELRAHAPIKRQTREKPRFAPCHPSRRTPA